MLRGALAMFDALGFKGIWRRVSRPELVVDKLKTVRASLDDHLQRTFGGHEYPRLGDPANTIRSIHTSFLSDTVAVAVVPKTLDELHEATRATTTEEQLAASAIAYTATLSGYVYRSALYSEPAWAYRGCIAYGDFYMEDRFLVGEAVDEAADHMNEAEGAFVWLAPSAKALFEKNSGGYGGRCTPLARYRVPLKGRGAEEQREVESFVASPFPWQPTIDQGTEVSDAVLRTFEAKADDPSVARKAGHTRTFFEHHRNELAAEHAEFERLYGRFARWS